MKLMGNPCKNDGGGGHRLSARKECQESAATGFIQTHYLLVVLKR